MTSTNVDRPLTDAQERALIALDTNYDLWVERGRPTLTDGYTRPPGVMSQTLDVLARLGMVETRVRPIDGQQLTVVARITDKGRELLRGMGD